MRKILLFLVLTLFCSDIYTQQIVIKLNEGFESSTFPPSGWKRISPLGAKVWERKVVPLPPEIMQPPIQGNAVTRIDLEYTGGDDWLISKKIIGIEAGDSLLFYLIKQGSGGPYPPDSLNIQVSTSDSLIQSFSTYLLNINIAGLPTGNQNWRRYCLPLTQFAGQNIFIAFHHKDVNGHGCAIDSIVVFNPNSIGIKRIGEVIPVKSELLQNFPNPFNPATNIKFKICKYSLVSLKVYDITGKEIITLVNTKLNPGYYQIPFSISLFSNYQITSGIYFYKFETEEFSDTKKMILIK